VVDPRPALKAIRARAPRALHVAEREVSRRFGDWRFGFPREAADNIPLDTVGLGAETRVGHEPSPWFILPRILGREEVGPEDVFVDIGAGMGRVVLEAARLYPFKRVVGVELSEEFARVARTVIEKNRHRLRCKQVDIVCADARDYRVDDDVTVVYLYNPFLGEVFAAAVQSIIASVDRRPRRLRLIYFNPEEHGQLVATGRFRQVRNGRRIVRRWRRTDRLRLYEVVP
jgi:SAM-dependent methyltransferase